MSDETRTPNANTVRSVFVRAHPFSASTSYEDRRAEFDRFINKVKADALREAAESARAVIDIGSSSDSAYHHGARYGQRKFADWLDVRAERIESEA